MQNKQLHEKTDPKKKCSETVTKIEAHKSCNIAKKICYMKTIC
jgi:hypothetical protein